MAQLSSSSSRFSVSSGKDGDGELDVATGDTLSTGDGGEGVSGGFGASEEMEIQPVKLSAIAIAKIRDWRLELGHWAGE